ncbi:hypothetical protein M0805_002396 [Coniferiporia weirii]|nr:hypothetical protein M0805_002396 [Coniferiporia weirii]
MPYPPTSKSLAMTNAMRPRPILKRVVAVSSESSASPLSPSPLDGSIKAAVHFPPHPALACTYTAHSADAYDRSPIAVAPNECALPARGCPGRTYRLDGGGDVVMDDDEDDGYTESTPGRAWKKSDHAHPRVRVLGFDTTRRYSSSSSSSGSDSSRTASPAQALLFDRAPPLVPDLSSSDTSEDSDQGTLAFAPFLNGTFASAPMSYHSTEPSNRHARPSLSPKSDPAQLAFLPHPHTHSQAYPYSSASGAATHAPHPSYSSRDPRATHRTSPSSPSRPRPRSRSRVRGGPVHGRRSAGNGFEGYGYYEREDGDEGCLGGF